MAGVRHFGQYLENDMATNFMPTRYRPIVLALMVWSTCVGLASGAAPVRTASPERPRVVLLTDYWKDPDEIQAMIRFLSYANEYEIEGLIATSLAFGDGSVRPEWIVDILGDYGRVYDTLKLHARPGYPFPTPESLKSVVRPGARMIRTWAGRNAAGVEKGFPVPYPPGALDTRTCEPVERWLKPGMESAGAELIIQVVDRKDPRPVWILVWGGAVDLAQAINKVRRDRSPEDAARFIGKIRLHQSNWQDTGTVWIWDHVPELFFDFTNVVKGGLSIEAPESLRDEAWVRKHLLEGHGPLAARYPKAGVNNKTGYLIKEGDSPTFLHLLAPGLTDIEQPEWGGWGGRRARLYPDRNFFVDGRDRNPASTDPKREMQWSLGRWAHAISNDFAARLDWQVKPPSETNHPPVARVYNDATTRVLQKTVSPGELVTLDATGSSDPDGNKLSYKWWQYDEPGTLGEHIRLKGDNDIRATFVAPQVSDTRTLHVILEVTDDGIPQLTGYRRVVFTIAPSQSKRAK